MEEIRLTKFSHGAGCGCKIAPQVLEEILRTDSLSGNFKNLLVGNHTNDDAAVFRLNDTEALIATTDFFTPIVDDPFIFGKVAAANAISDVYAMGGKPVLSLAILGWPVEKLPVTSAQEVMEGARLICKNVGIPLAGGHSIDSVEPIFGLAVNGLVKIKHLKQNNKARAGDLLMLTKPIGVGVFSTALKRELIDEPDTEILYDLLTKVNSIGEKLGEISGVHAMTDVTGFGLAGHTIEIAENSNLLAILEYDKIPKLPGLAKYLSKNIIPDATYRNWKGYGEKIDFDKQVNMMEAFQLLPDPQTNGGLLIAVSPESLNEVQVVLEENGYADFIEPIGKMEEKREKVMKVL